jgi:hypothetical protein
MDTLANYQEIVCSLILEYASYKPFHGEIETEVIIDREKGHYEVLHVGWDGARRVHGILIHIDIIGDKIWIQHDGTSPGIAEELIEAGIPHEAIVLGFHPEHLRQYTGFATA